MPDEEMVPEGLSKDEFIARLRPNTWSEMGFLGENESFDAVKARDEATLKRLNLTYDSLADALEGVLTQALEIWNAPVTPDNMDAMLGSETNFPNLYKPDSLPVFDLNNLPDAKLGVMVGHLQVFIMVYKGWQECPWEDAAEGSADFMILNRHTGESVTAPELMPHLIREHHFFEGTGTPFRTDPEQLAKVLDMIKNS